MTPKERAAMQQALAASKSAADVMVNHGIPVMCQEYKYTCAIEQLGEAITALREALTAQTEPLMQTCPACGSDYWDGHTYTEQAEPMTDTELINANCRYTTSLMTEQAEQEPVAVALLKSSKANFERQFGKQVFADWVYDDLTYSFENSAPVQPVKQEPLCNQHPDAPHGFARNASHGAGRYVCECEGWEPEQVEQEPVEHHVENVYGRDGKYFAWIGDNYVQIYAAPVRTKDLTDDEIDKIATDLDEEDPDEGYWRDFARAVIAAYKEKNHG